MRKRPQSSSAPGEPGGSQNPTNVPPPRSSEGVKSPKRSVYAVVALFILVINGSWAVYHYQYESLPEPLGASQAGKRGFSEKEAIKHVTALTELGPHTVGSDALDVAVQYVLTAAEDIKNTAHWEVDVQVDFFHAKTGANRLSSGLFKGKTLAYSDLSHIVLRILPKYSPEAEDRAILVSSHIDTVFSAEGAGDCSSCIAVMLELARGVSQWAHGFKNSIIFLFNTGEEEGLNGAHSFITQHPWSSSIRLAVDLEAMGIGGKSGIFQTGRDPWAVEAFAMVAKYPSAQITAQDLFSSGAIKSATDFQIYKDVAGLSGLDFAYTDNTAVYHTKNDKLKLLTPGSLQHLGENMLAFLLHAGASSHLPSGEATKADHDPAVFFDILGSYLVVYRQRFANMLYNSVILQSLLIWCTSLLLGGYPAVVSLALSCLSVVLMWICSLGLSILVAFILPQVSSSPVPFLASPLLAVGLFAAPALIGALIGQHFGYLILQKYLLGVSSTRRANLSPTVQADLAKLDAERWLFKAGLVQWLILLALGNYYKIGSSYLALVWLVGPAFAYGLLEATLSPGRLPRPIKTLTLLMGLSFPFLISAGSFIRLAGTIIGSAVRFDRNPGSTPEWVGSVILAAYIGIIMCLTLVYLLSCVHFSGAKTPIIIVSITLFGLSLAAVLSGFVPPFTEDISRAVNVVHVVDTTATYGGKQEPVSYISLFSTTPGKLTREIESIGEGFVCGRENAIDFVTFSVKYGCWSRDNVDSGWSESDIPLLHVEDDTKENDRITKIVIDTKTSTRWTLGINTIEIEDFKLKGSSDDDDIVPLGDKTSADGWHTIQFSGGKKAPTKFDLTLHWANKDHNHTHGEDKLLKLRTDVDRMTPKAQRIVDKLPLWCSQFGKSTSPHNLAFLAGLPVNF